MHTTLTLAIQLLLRSRTYIRDTDVTLFTIAQCNTARVVLDNFVEYSVILFVAEQLFFLKWKQRGVVGGKSIFRVA